MNIRVKFRKYGALRFVGHLDVMRYFQKALRRADIDVRFSEGFSPHMVMSFASPLGVGLSSDGEYMDISVNTSPSSADAVGRLNGTMAEGMEVIRWRLLPEGSKNAMSIVAAADYELRFRDGCAPEEGWQERFVQFLSQPEIRAVKETKKGPQEMDLRPLIRAYAVEDGMISLRLSAGSAHNVKPELLWQAFTDWAGIHLTPFALLVHRKELYAEAEDGRFVPLEDFGEEILESVS